MKKAILITIFLSFTLYNLQGQGREQFTLYLIRHSEKVIDKNNLRDPPLTDCGKLRSESLVKYFSSTKIKRIYSSDYERTRETARPLSEDRKLEIEIYDANNLKELAEMLINKAEDAVIIGHSNSTPLLGSLLTGKELYLIPENDYGRIYQVIITPDSTILNIFHSAFCCTQKN